MAFEASIFRGDGGFDEVFAHNERHAGTIVTAVETWLASNHISVGAVAVQAVGGRIEATNAPTCRLEPPIPCGGAHEGLTIVLDLARYLNNTGVCSRVDIIDDRFGVADYDRLIHIVTEAR